MDLELQPPRDPTLTLGPKVHPPPKNPSDRPTSPHPPQNLPANGLENQLSRLPAETPDEDSPTDLNAAIMQASSLPLYTTEYDLAFKEAIGGLTPGANQGLFNSSAKLIVETLQGGPSAPEAPCHALSSTDWARLVCALLAAITRGHNLLYSQTLERSLKKDWAEAPDPDPLSPNRPTLFHRIAAAADYLGDQVTSDQIDLASWTLEVKANLRAEAAKAVQREVDESCRQWKIDKINQYAMTQKAQIAEEVRKKNVDYFLSVAAELSFRPPLPPPQGMLATGDTPRGKKRTASGSMALPRPNPSTPGTPKAPLQDVGTPRGRPAKPLTPTRRWADPSPTPQPRKRTLPTPQATLSLSPKVTLKLGPKIGAPTPATAGKLDAASILAAIQAAIVPAIQTAMAPYTARIVALERSAMPPPVTRTGLRTSQDEQPGQHGNAALQPGPHPPPNQEQDNFTPVTRNGKGRRARGKGPASGPDPEPMHQNNSTPASYAGAAAAAANIQQVHPQKKSSGTNPLSPAITEVTVLREGGYLDSLKENQTRARAADAIVRETRLKMAKAIAKPIRLRAGRWSISPCSKGNFVYSFDGNVPFDVIQSYEHILLAPFGGHGVLCPSMGWTRFLANGVPVWDDDDSPFSPGELLEEVRTLPGLKKAFFAMQPRWLTHVDRISSLYSSVTFAISDPDGTISNTLLNNRAALFGKEVAVRKWIDKPAFIQSSRCHALGHNKASRVCTLSKDSVRCYICGGAHPAEDHHKLCPKKHNVVGICDCKRRCLNCHNFGHNCKDQKCPTRDQYRPKNTRKPKAKSKPPPRDMDGLYSWENELGWGEEDRHGDWNEEQYGADPEDPLGNFPPELPPTLAPMHTTDPTSVPAPKPTHVSPSGSQIMNVDYDLEDPFTGRPTSQDEPLAGWEPPRVPLPVHKDYSPSHPQGDANPPSLA